MEEKVELKLSNELFAFNKYNKLTFEKGRRNSDIVTLAGFTLYLGGNKEQMMKAIYDIMFFNIHVKKAPMVSTTLGVRVTKMLNEMQDEIDYVYDYAKKHAYGNWWKTKAATEKYMFTSRDIPAGPVTEETI